MKGTENEDKAAEPNAVYTATSTPHLHANVAKIDWRQIGACLQLQLNLN